MVQNGAVLDPSALFACLERSSPSTLRTLLDTGLDPNLRRHGAGKEDATRDKEVPRSEKYCLWIAAMQHGIQADKTTAQKRKTSDTAIELVNVLLSHGADPLAIFSRPNPSRILSLEDRAGSILISTEEVDAEVEFEKTSILHDLLENGEVVHPMLELPGLDVQQRDSRGRTLLHAASRSRFGLHTPIDTLFDDFGMEPENSSEARPSFLHLLGPRETDKLAVDCQQRNILHLMLTASNKYRPSCHPMLKLLPLLSNAEVAVLIKQADVYGNTPLHLALRYAIWHVDTSPVDALLGVGADPFAQDNQGNTALHILACCMEGTEGLHELFSNLLGRGLDINARNFVGQTPVFNLFKTPQLSRIRSEFLAREFAKAAQALKIFEDAGADLFVRDNRDTGLLHVAARCKVNVNSEWNWMMRSGSDRADWNRMVQERDAMHFKMLMDRGLDLAIEDNQKRTALDVAVACNNQGVLNLFEKEDARNKVAGAQSGGPR